MLLSWNKVPKKGQALNYLNYDICDLKITTIIYTEDYPKTNIFKVYVHIHCQNLGI